MSQLIDIFSRCTVNIKYICAKGLPGSGYANVNKHRIEEAASWIASAAARLTNASDLDTFDK